jgi:hypothetical protein
MKPPTTDALRYAATVLGRDVTQIERLLERESIPGAARDELGKLLAHVRSVRTWILGVQMPIAQRRDARERIRKGAGAGVVASVLHDRKPCTECGELMAFDHTVCFYCATGTRPAAQCSDCGATLAHVIGPNVKGTVCPVCDPDSSLLEDSDHDIACRCSECGAAPILPADLKLLQMACAPLFRKK